MKNYIFAYGTLTHGLQLNSILRDSCYLGPAMMQGILFDLGSYPGFKDGGDVVIGEIYAVDDKTLAMLDIFEGYVADEPKKSLFSRLPRIAREFGNGQTREVQVYCFNHAVQSNQRIGHGDYRRYLAESRATPRQAQWVIAYGSNLLKSRIEERVGAVHDGCQVTLPGYRLVFNKQASSMEHAYANIQYDGKSVCQAFAWMLTQDQIDLLDQYEGVPNHYLRIGQPLMIGGRETIGHLYIAHPEKLVQNAKPEPDHNTLIHQGYRSHGFMENVLPKNSVEYAES